MDPFPVFGRERSPSSPDYPPRPGSTEYVPPCHRWRAGSLDLAAFTSPWRAESPEYAPSAPWRSGRAAASHHARLPPIGRQSSSSPDYSPSTSPRRVASPEYVPLSDHWRRAASPDYAPLASPSRVGSPEYVPSNPWWRGRAAANRHHARVSAPGRQSSSPPDYSPSSSTCRVASPDYMPLTDHWRRVLAVFPADYTLPIPLQQRPDYAASTPPLGRSRSPDYSPSTPPLRRSPSPDYSPSASSWRPASPEYVPTAPWRRAASPQYAPPTRPERAATYPDRAPCPSPVVPADAGSRTSSRPRCYHPYQRSGVRTCTCSACRG